MRKSKKLRTLVKQAGMGNPRAAYLLGIRYQLGHGFPQDISKAAEWISFSAVLGYPPALEWIKDYAFDDDARTQANA